MKKSIDRVYDAAIEQRETMTIRLWLKGWPCDIDNIGTAMDRLNNKLQTSAFNELVEAGIVIAGDGIL